MIKKILGLLLLISAYVQAQENETLVYPKGIYETFEAYQNRQPTDLETEFTFKTSRDSIKHRFYKVADEKRLRKAFAFSDGNYLYVSAKYIYKHLNRKDSGKQLKDDGNYHLKAHKLGANYHYFENFYTSTAAVIWGGTIATAAARRVKGVVYDIAHKEFNIFRNAKDFKNFVKENHKPYIKDHLEIETIKGKEDLQMIRSFINEVY